MTPDVWLRKGDGSMVDRAIVAMMDGALRRGCGEPWGRGAERPRAGRRVGRKRGEKPAGTATRSATTYVQRAVAKGDAWSVVCYMGQFAQCQTHAMRTLCDGVALCGTSRSVIYRCDPGRVRGAQPLRLSARALRRNISLPTPFPGRVPFKGTRALIVAGMPPELPCRGPRPVSAPPWARNV